MAVPLKKCFELIKRCPALILASIFTHWTFGPIKSPQNQKSCKNFAFRNGKIGVSYFYTLINIMIKLLVTFFIILNFTDFTGDWSGLVSILTLLVLLIQYLLDFFIVYIFYIIDNAKSKRHHCCFMCLCWSWLLCCECEVKRSYLCIEDDFTEVHFVKMDQPNIDCTDVTI